MTTYCNAVQVVPLKGAQIHRLIYNRQNSDRNKLYITISIVF